MSERREKPAKVIPISPRSKSKVSSTPYSDLLTRLMTSATPMADSCTELIQRLMTRINGLQRQVESLEGTVELLKKMVGPSVRCILHAERRTGVIAPTWGASNIGPPRRQIKKWSTDSVTAGMEAAF